MLRIHQKAAGVERADLVGACVHAIARNVILDRYRSARIQLEEPIPTGIQASCRLPWDQYGLTELELEVLLRIRAGAAISYELPFLCRPATRVPAVKGIGKETTRIGKEIPAPARVVGSPRIKPHHRNASPQRWVGRKLRC